MQEEGIRSSASKAWPVELHGCDLQDSTGRTTMMLASVAHVARGMRDAVYVSAEVDYPPRRMNHTSPVDEPAATLKSARRSLPAGIVKVLSHFSRLLAPSFWPISDDKNRFILGLKFAAFAGFLLFFFSLP